MLINVVAVGGKDGDWSRNVYALGGTRRSNIYPARIKEEFVLLSKQQSTIIVYWKDSIANGASIAPSESERMNQSYKYVIINAEAGAPKPCAESGRSIGLDCRRATDSPSVIDGLLEF